MPGPSGQSSAEAEAGQTARRLQGFMQWDRGHPNPPPRCARAAPADARQRAKRIGCRPRRPAACPGMRVFTPAIPAAELGVLL